MGRTQNQAQAVPQQGQVQGNAPAPHPVANGANNAGRANVPPHMAAAVAAAAAAQQNRPRGQMQAPVNGAVQNGMPQMNGNLAAPGQMTPQQQMQAMQAQQQRMHQLPGQQADPQIVMQARRLQEQQRLAQMHQIQQQQQQQQQQQGNNGAVVQGQQQSSPPMRANNMMQQNFMNNAQAQAMIANYNVNGNGHVAGQANGLHMPNGPAGNTNSRPVPQFPPNIMAQIAQIEANVKAKNPGLTAEQARQLATEHLTRAMVAQRQNAMNAAAGGASQPGMPNAGGATTSPHQYAAMLRQQQALQQQQQHVQQGQGQPQGQMGQQQQQAQQPQQMQQRATPMSTSPVPIPAQPQVHQRQSSGSATPSVGK